MKRVVVSGATGFIGRSLAVALAARGDRVTALTRDPGRARRALPEPIELVRWSLAEGDAALACVDGAGAVVHLAGEPAVGARWTESKKTEIRDSRVISTERIVGAIRGASRRPGAFVCASAVGYYGARGGEAVDESGAGGDDFLARVTADWERAARGAEEVGVRVVRARLGIVLARGGGALAEMVKPFRAFAGGPIGSGHQVVSWVHLDDVVRVLLLAIDDAAVAGAVNVTAPNAVTNAELAAAIGKALHRPAFVRAPAFALRLRFGEGAEPLLTGQRVVPRALRERGYAFRFTDVEDALREALG